MKKTTAKPFAVPGSSSALLAEELHTLRDLIRYGVSAFTKAGLYFGHGADNATDEAIFLIGEALHLPREADLSLFLDARLTQEEKEKILTLIDTRVRTRKPAPYLVNRAYLQGIPFYVDERVIIPRSYIAEILCAEESDLPLADPHSIEKVLDLCTGSGCLALIAASLFPQAQVDAVDISADALAVAKINVENHIAGERVTLFEGDLFKPLGARKYDLILSNPPYVDAQGMEHLPEEYLHEPALALESGSDGLDIVRRILKDAAKYLTPSGALLCEIGRCREDLESAFPDLPFLWLESETSAGEVFFLTRDQLV